MNEKLNNDLNIPKIGFGTWKLPNNDDTIEIINNAIEVGYTHIDTAKAYGNEVYIGRGIKKSKIPRKNLFITGKLWNTDRNNVIKACEESIKNLTGDYLDLYLMHWPASKAVHDDWKEINAKVWRQMEELYTTGKVKAIGVCNFKKKQLEELLKSAKIKPMVNQIEFHPGFIQEETVEYCKKNDIIIEAWSPLGSGKMLKKKQLIDISSKYNKTVSELCISYCQQHGVIPIVRSKNKERMIMNLKSDSFISDEDMKLLDELPYIGGSGLDSETLTLFD